MSTLQQRLLFLLFLSMCLSSTVIVTVNLMEEQNIITNQYQKYAHVKIHRLRLNLERTLNLSTTPLNLPTQYFTRLQHLDPTLHSLILTDTNLKPLYISGDNTNNVLSTLSTTVTPQKILHNNTPTTITFNTHILSSSYLLATPIHENTTNVGFLFLSLTFHHPSLNSIFLLIALSIFTLVLLTIELTSFFYKVMYKKPMHHVQTCLQNAIDSTLIQSDRTGCEECSLLCKKLNAVFYTLYQRYILFIADTEERVYNTFDVQTGNAIQNIQTQTIQTYFKPWIKRQPPRLNVEKKATDVWLHITISWIVLLMTCWIVSEKYTENLLLLVGLIGLTTGGLLSYILKQTQIVFLLAMLCLGITVGGSTVMKSLPWLAVLLTALASSCVTLSTSRYFDDFTPSLRLWLGRRIVVAAILGSCLGFLVVTAGLVSLTPFLHGIAVFWLLLLAFFHPTVQ